MSISLSVCVSFFLDYFNEFYEVQSLNKQPKKHVKSIFKNNRSRFRVQAAGMYTNTGNVCMQLIRRSILIEAGRRRRYLLRKTT